MDKPADIDAKVTDDRGATVALLRSYHDGMGRFELVPDPRRTYKIEITRPSGIGKTYPLPAAKSEGCTLQSIDDYTSARPDLRIAVWCTHDQDVVATAVLRDKRVATRATHVTASQASVLSFPMTAGAQGAVRVTLFDDRLNARAERLVYRNRGSDLRIDITPDKPTYTPRGRVTMSIAARLPDGSPAPNTDLALSVVDDTVLSFADDKQATMLARLYLEADMPGQKIEEPNFYFGKDPKAPAAIDLVLGTHGWRRFEWKPVLSAPPEKPIEENWAYTGDLIAPKKKPVTLRAKGAKAKDAVESPTDVAPLEEGEPEVVAVAANVAKPPVAAGPADANEARPKKKAARVNEDDAEEADTDDEPMAAREMMLDAAPAPAADWGGEDAMGDEMFDGDVAHSVSRKVLAFDNRGFDVGTEAGRHRIVIRDKPQQEVAQDPYWNLVESRQFPVARYDERYDGPRTDFRETLFWAPRLSTDAEGKATVSFSLSDEVTSFKAIAEGVGGGKLGRGEALVQSKKPVSLAVKLPLEVTAGDRIRLPVTIANETDRPYEASLSARFGKAFKVTGGALPASITLAPNERRSTFYEISVIGDGKDADDGKIALGVEAANHKDDVEKTIVVAPVGFPQQVSLSGTLSGTVRRDVYIGDVMPGTMNGMVTLYPSPLATMVEGTEAMLAEPGGCFE